MIKMLTLTKTLLLTSLATSIVSCAPTITNQSGTRSIIDLQAVAVTEVDSSGNAKPSVGLSWSALANEASRVLLFRRESTQNESQVKLVDNVSDLNKTTYLDSKSDELTTDIAYIYNMRVDDANKNRLAIGESSNAKVADASVAKDVVISIPAKDGDELFDIKNGISFSWESNGADLYYVSVKEPSGTITWASFTTQTNFNYGADSQTAVPKTLQSFFPISRVNPVAESNEIAFKALKTGDYKIEVKAVFTDNNVSLGNAKSLVIRSSGERTFKFNDF